jgi:hypothetical protein
MENKNNKKYNFLAQTLILYAVNILLLLIITYLFGDGAKEISPLYKLGSKGLPISTLLQFLLSSSILIAVKTIFYSERIFRRMMALWRIVLMLLSMLISMVIFIIIFDWFPMNNIHAWGGFLLCFGGGIVSGILYMILKTKWDSKRYDELLVSYKNQHGGDDHNE